jgi:hypothetical protein
MLADPPRRTSLDEVKRTHVIEVEHAGGLSVQSVYQAHCQGRFANYTWVVANFMLQSKTHADQIEWAASELGVGLVSFTKPHVASTFDVRRLADYRVRTRADRDEVMKQVRGISTR